MFLIYKTLNQKQVFDACLNRCMVDTFVVQIDVWRWLIVYISMGFIVKLTRLPIHDCRLKQTRHMKKMKPFLMAGMIVLLFTQCKKTIKEPTAPAGNNRTATPEAFETVIDGSFANYTTFEQYWNYLYPWGSDHNGAARM